MWEEYLNFKIRKYLTPFLDHIFLSSETAPRNMFLITSYIFRLLIAVSLMFFCSLLPLYVFTVCISLIDVQVKQEHIVSLFKLTFPTFNDKFMLKMMKQKRPVSVLVHPIIFLFTTVYFPVLLTLKPPDTACHLCCVPSPLHELCHLQPCDVWPPEPHLSAGQTIIMITHLNYKL